MNAVIYARYSSDKQKETSITGQLRECYAYAERKGITVIKEYIDRAQSGKRSDREAFQQMITDSKFKLFSAVIVYKLDRFARDRYASATYRHELKKNKVKIISAMENISDTPEGILMESLLEGMAEYYSSELAQKVLRGKTELALKCLHNGGNPLIGYKVNPDKTYAIDEAAAPIVRLIFDMYAAGYTYSQIIDELNNRRYKTRAGKNFGKNSLHDILANERYIGTYTFNKIPSRDTNGSRNCHAKKDSNDIIKIENGIPAIIDRNTWERVQFRMKQNRKAPARACAKIDYLLTGKAFCGHCGSAMVGQSTGKDNQYGYYQCGAKKRLRNCDKKNVKKETIEDAVLKFAIEYVFQDEVIDRVAKAAAEYSLSESKKTDILESLKKELETVKHELANIVDAIKKGIITSSTKEALEQLENERDSLELEIAGEQIVTEHPFSAEQVSTWLKYFRSGDINDPYFRQQLIDIFINAVYIYDDHVKIIFNFGDNTNQINIKDIGNLRFSDLESIEPLAP